MSATTPTRTTPVSSTSPTGVSGIDDAFATGPDPIGWRFGHRMPWASWTAVVLAVATLFARLPGMVFNGVFDRDEAYLAVTGDVIRHGGRLYVDVIDRKPPIVPLAYAFVRDVSTDMRAVRLAVALLVFLNGLVVVGIVRRVSGSRRAALLAGVLAVLGSAMFLPADAHAANFELWGLLPATFAVFAVLLARTSSRPWLWFAIAGAAVVIAADCKQPYIVLAVPVVFEAIRRGRDRWLAAGAAFVGAVVAFAPLAIRYDATRMVRWVWTDNGDYLSGGIPIGHALLVGAGLSLGFLVFHLPLLYGLWATVTRRLRLDATVWVWLAVSVLVVPIGLRFFGHYYQQVVPPLAVLTGLALPGARRRVWGGLTVLAVVTTLVFVVVAFVYRPHLTDYRSIGRYVERTTSSQDRIVVWGALPDIYVVSERDPAGIFLHDGYLTGNWPRRTTPLPTSAMLEAPYGERWDMFFAAVAAHPPAVVVDAARAGTDWEEYGPSAYPIGTWLAQCYQRETVIDGFVVWRRDATRCPS